MSEADDRAPWRGLGPYGIVPGQRRIVQLDPDDPDLDFTLTLLTWDDDGLLLIERERREAAEGRAPADQAELYRRFLVGLRWLWDRRDVSVPSPLAQYELEQLMGRTAREIENAEARARAWTPGEPPPSDSSPWPAWLTLAPKSRGNDKWGPLIPFLDYAMRTTLDPSNGGILRRMAEVCRQHEAARDYCAEHGIDTGLEIPIPRTSMGELKTRALEHRRARRADP